jgi:hypothetical protein
MTLSELPQSAAWRHHLAREGFESAFLETEGSGYRLRGTTAAVESGEAWTVQYLISLDEQWITRTAHIWSRARNGDYEVRVETDGSGKWQINGSAARKLDGCLDIDLESSACTNTIPVHRVQLGVGQSAEAPAVYVRALDLSIERLEQQYTRMPSHDTHQRYDYRCPALNFESTLRYDNSGLVLEYPGIASRVL